MKAGKFVSPSDISNENNLGLYPCYGGNGLRGYTKTYTHEGRFPLIGRQGALCGNVCFVQGKFHATEHAVVAKPYDNVDVDWLFYQVRFLNLKQYATGTAQPGLSVQNISKVPVKIPSILEQQKIVAEIEALEKQISEFQIIIDNSSELRNSILEKYL